VVRVESTTFADRLQMDRRTIDRER
jgi:hypothetical protein